jgi:hypothetical protein
MKCRYSQNDIALYVEQDLPARSAREIELHLVTCDLCRTLAEELRESQSMLKGLKQDTVSAAVLASVRSQILAELGARRMRPAWGRWVYALAGGLLAVIISVLWIADVKPGTETTTDKNGKQLLPPREAQARKDEASSSPLMTAGSPSPLTSINTSPYRARASRRRLLPDESTPDKQVSVLEDGTNFAVRSEVADGLPAQTELPDEPPKQIVVKLLTDDPNVVIYWLMDQKNGGTL